MARRKRKYETTKLDVTGAIQSGMSDIGDIKDELVEWRDNMENNNLGSTPKFDEVNEAAEMLENLEEPDMSSIEDDAIGGMLGDVEVRLAVGTRSWPLSRQARLDNGTAYLEAARDTLQGFLDETPDAEEAEDDEDAPVEDEAEDATADGAEDENAPATITPDQRSEIETLISELDDIIGEVGNVTCPGMY